MVKNKKGKLNTVMLIVFIFLGVMGTIILGIFVFGANLIDQSFLSIDVVLGEVNFTESYEDTLGIGINAFIDSADNYGIGLLLGMVILMIVSSFIFKEKQKAWMIMEVLILIIAFIFVSTLQGSYTLIINSSAELLDIYSIDLVNSSKFILNLHIIVPIVWAFIVVISYGLFKKGEDSLADLGA